jgi:hypothetical protein
MRQPANSFRNHRHHRRIRNSNLLGDAVGLGSNLLLPMANLELEAVDRAVEGIAVDAIQNTLVLIPLPRVRQDSTNLAKKMIWLKKQAC